MSSQSAEKDRTSAHVDRPHRTARHHSHDESHPPSPQQAAGNLAVQRLLRANEHGPSLNVSHANDQTERNAERTADQALAGRPFTGRTNSSGSRRGPRPTSFVSEALGSTGAPLDPSARMSMEQFFGSDLSSVRVHTGTQADASARALNAQAYSVGNEIVFRNEALYESGPHLLAHELAHVVGDSSGSTIYRQPTTEEDVPKPGEVEVPDPGDVVAGEYTYPWKYPRVRGAIYQHREEALTNFLRVFAEIEIDKKLMPVKDVTSQEFHTERARVDEEFKATNEALKPDPKNEPLKMKWIRLNEDLKYLDATVSGKFPTKGPALERVKKRWTAYIYSKKNDAGKDLEHDDLLGRVLDRFDADKTFTRYPKWLRYMVIHFSGLRYEGAHGSYAPVTELLRALKKEEIRHNLSSAEEKEIDNLAGVAESELTAEAKTASRKRKPEIEKRLKKLRGVETTIQSSFKKSEADKLRAFEDLMQLESERERVVDIDPDFAAELDDRAAELTKTIGAARLKSVQRSVAKAKKERNEAVIQHEIARAQTELKNLDDAQALAMLKKMREEGAFPDWFWKEAVATTALRLEETDLSWTKKMTPRERAELKKKGPITRHWLAVLDKWKEETTAWRSKHGGDLSLVVSRAVCNEIAEQCLHARGVQPKGGIGQKATWYDQGTSGRSFARPTKDNLAPGASLFWAAWSDTRPTDNVHKIRENLFPVLRNEDNETIFDGMKDSKGRTYHVGADNLVTREDPIETPIDPTVAPRTKTQFLVWKHEAIIAEVDEAHGRVVTFETGPIGIGTRRLKGTDKLPKTGILDNPNVYIGFSPSGPEPPEIDAYLKDILPGR